VGRRDRGGGRLLRLGAGAPLQEPVGGAVDAGRNAGADLPHHGLRPARAAAGMAADGRRNKPDDAGRRSRTAGVRRIGALGRILAGDRRGDRNARRGCRARAARDAADRTLMAPSEAVVGIAERVLHGNWIQGERNGTAFAYTRPSPNRYPWQWYWD